MPTQMSLSTTRVVDPVLTNVARGYKMPEAVGSALFPYVPVGVRGGKIVTFGQDDFYLYNTARAPGGEVAQVQFGHASGSFTLEDHALRGVVPLELLEDARVTPGVDLASAAVMRVQRNIGLRLEKAQADLATTAGNFDSNHKLTSLSSTSLWSDLVNSDPLGCLEAGREAIRSSIGMYPNVLILGAKVFASLKQHSKIVDRIKYVGSMPKTQSGVPTVTTQALADILGVDQVFVGGMSYLDATGAATDVWGKTAVLAYSNVGSIADLGSPSFGYTYRLRNYPVVDRPYFNEGNESWMYTVRDAVSPVIAGATAGYLISPCVA